MGDIHGAKRAVEQCLERSGFDKEKDELIQLGDIVDGWKEVRETIDLLLEIKNLVVILGNHDQWAIDWWDGHFHGDIWTTQGGQRTIASYGNDPTNVPQSHRDFFKKAALWFEDEKNRLFVHGGFDADQPIEGQPISDFLWDRSLVERACMRKRQKDEDHLSRFSEVYVGHTSTPYLNHRFKFVHAETRRKLLQDPEAMKPIHACEIWMMDTGAGYEGKLTIMDIDTKEYWQSDRVADLYPDDEHGKQ